MQCWKECKRLWIPGAALQNALKQEQEVRWCIICFTQKKSESKPIWICYSAPYHHGFKWKLILPKIKSRSNTWFALQWPILKFVLTSWMVRQTVYWSSKRWKKTKETKQQSFMSKSHALLVQSNPCPVRLSHRALTSAFIGILCTALRCSLSYTVNGNIDGFMCLKTWLMLFLWG